MTAYYRFNQILIAAASAYLSSVAGDIDEYVINKSETFLKRCIHSMYCEDMIEEGTNISQILIPDYIIANIAYAALDASCEEVFWQSLKNGQSYPELNYIIEKYEIVPV